MFTAQTVKYLFLWETNVDSAALKGKMLFMSKFYELIKYKNETQFLFHGYVKAV